MYLCISFSTELGSESDYNSAYLPCQVLRHRLFRWLFSLILAYFLKKKTLRRRKDHLPYHHSWRTFSDHTELHTDSRRKLGQVSYPHNLRASYGQLVQRLIRTLELHGTMDNGQEIASGFLFHQNLVFWSYCNSFGNCHQLMPVSVRSNKLTLGPLVALWALNPPKSRKRNRVEESSNPYSDP